MEIWIWKGKKPTVIEERKRKVRYRAYLKYYKEERRIFAKAWKKQLSWKELEVVSKKLARHFKIYYQYRLEYGKRNGANRYKVVIYNLNFGVLCHELAHVMEFRLFRKAGHRKSHWKIMKRMIKYCEKKSWFEQELERRTRKNIIRDFYSSIS